MDVVDWFIGDHHVNLIFERFSLQLIQFFQQVLLIFFRCGTKQCLPFLKLGLIFSHLFLHICNVIVVNLYGLVNLVALYQAIHHIDISMGGLDSHFLLHDHDLLTVELG